MKKINGFIQQITGWNPGLRSFSLVALPRPSSVVKSILVTPVHGRGGPLFFWGHTKATLAALFSGFFLGNLIAMIIATLFLYLPPVQRALMPFSLALRSIPLVAITPLLLRIRFSIADLPMVKDSPILYPIFGTEQAIKMFIVCIVVFFPTLVNVYQGFKSVDAPALELMHSLNASQWYIFWNLRVPYALPLTFSALKIAASASVGGVVIAEWLSSNKGLGYVMYAGSSSASLSTADMWVAMILSTILALVLFWLVSVVEKAAIPWHESVIALKEAMEGFDKRQG
ncbi:MAG: ABC transporter permease subunit [Anaerolineales bacterium]|nr:ABC transporter permease subunit [Anaerolineales bacterium]